MKHPLTPQEEKALEKLSNVVYDQLNNDLQMCEERIDEVTRRACVAVRLFLQEGR